ncbi:unnamed protein product [Arabidopsis lyrata]|uniref:Ubiquitin thiolesterase n=1 Tax=Arabidopsis lyrata subsp. lyrata TaxID=81972 RepID=D7ME56_ARALL|nr:uncharacterized membrane protein At1g16860 [Arabidopsis lyrata subsp. lyrata]EFH44037.1 ubiquitin thiolesterase [Arabidopsis lyrata subsp. lyrata]CAH8275734.1 unnamed protein product [Arabidopsis lyrata]|eukprot:XP_002867778.1 uncharacterized membrane protein At1g16860 [Arabidopsis lyrata subsp. lyrata]
MAGRIQSHQLPNGLYVSGKLEQPKERPPTMAARAVPYTGGDIKKSGELGRMFDISVVDSASFQGPPPLIVGGNSSGGASRIQAPPRVSGSSSNPNSGSVRSGPNSGSVKKFSGPLSQLQPTGLITSGSLGSSGPILSGSRRSGQLDHQLSNLASSKPKYGSSVTSLNVDPVRVGFKVPKAMVWAVLIVAAMGLLVGAFLTVAVKKPVVIAAVLAAVCPAIVVLIWNCVWRRKGLLSFIKRYPDAELRGAIDGQFVKVTGVVTCGSIPLESSYQRTPRCVYVSTELYEYKGFGGKSANPKHRCFSWGSRHAEKYVSDFYISDFQSGLRALVKAGYGSKVSPFVKPATVANVTTQNKDLSPSFLKWLSDRNLSADDRVMRLKEGYIKEGSTVSVMGMVRRHDNVLMIVPPAEAVSSGCRWWHCLFPTYADGLIITCDDNQNADVIPV